MDTGEGRFTKVDKPFSEMYMNDLRGKFPNHGGTFHEGEEVEIKGSLFRISKIIRNGLKLELLPR